MSNVHASPLRIHLLGEFRLFAGDESVYAIDRSRQQALLAYLLLHRHAPQSRQQIAFCFWPDSTEAQAYTNLRKLFFQLRQVLPHADTFLFADTQSIGWQPAAPYTLDAVELEHVLDQLEKSTTPAPETVAQVVTLYRGELLPGCYDDWILPLRRALHERVVNALEKALEGLEAQREYEAGLRCGEHLLRLDPLYEATYRYLMRFRALSGDQAGALWLYHECVRVLQRELEVEPSPETQEVYERILNRQLSEQAQTTKAPVLADTPQLVGRMREWALLRASWQRALQGQAHLVVITGEAGIGKTRLAEELFIWAGHQGALTARTRFYATQGALAYTPITELLRTEVLSSHLAKLGDVWQEEVARLLPELLEARPHLRRLDPMTERGQRGRFFEALARAMVAHNQPLLLLVDDLQWCDQETLEWLTYLFRFDPTARLLVVGTVRDNELDLDHPFLIQQLDLQRTDQITEIALSPLSAEETAALAAQIARQNLAAEQAEQLYQETKGNPLFVVEIIRAKTSEGFPTEALSTTQAVNSAASNLPAKVYTVIRSRLRQLSVPAQEVASLASTIGRSFTFNVLAAISDQSEEALVQALDELWRRRIVREQAGDAYDFSHDWLRDVAYAEISRMRRRLLHRRIAQALECLHAARVDNIAGELAVHYEQAGQIEQAVGYLQRAGKLALMVGAYPEAVTRLRKALDLLQALSLEQESAMRQELAILVPLGTCLIALQGYGNPEIEAVYRRAHQLCTQLGDDPHLMPILVGLSLFYMIRGKLHQAHRIGQQYLLLAQRTQDDGLLLEGHCAVGPILMYLGEFRSSVTHLEQTLALYDPAHHSVHAAVYGQEPGVAGQVCLAISLWQLGYPDRSLYLMQEALALAHKVSHLYTLSLAQSFIAHLYHLRQEPAEALVAATTSEELARWHGFQYWLVVSIMFQGWATARLSALTGKPAGQTQETIAQMQAAYAGFKQSGAGLFRGYYLSLIAEAQAAAQAVDAALTGLDEALALIDENDDRFWLAELQRLRGELLLASMGAVEAVDGEAEAAFLQAIRTAQAQEARMLELRAAMSLSRLWMRQGRRAEARTLLGEIFAWFTEGFDTVDLKEARSLLEALT